MDSRENRDNHIFVTIPVPVLRDVLGRDHPRNLLLHVAESEDPPRYSAARRNLDLHPQQFQRALDTLEENGLVGLRAPDNLNSDHADRDYHVVLELTAMGALVADLWDRMNTAFSDLAQEHGVPEGALATGAPAD